MREEVLIGNELSEAEQCLAVGDDDQAFNRLQKLAAKFPRRPRIWFAFGCAASELGQVELAEQAWRKAADLGSGVPEILLSLGYYYLGLRRMDQARFYFMQAIAVDPGCVNSRISLAVFLEQNHEYEQSRVAVDECLAISPEDDQARYMLALLAQHEDKLDEAERRLRDLIKSNPKHEYVRYACRYDLANLLDRQERYDEAMLLLVEAKKMVRVLADVELMLERYDVRAQKTRLAATLLPRNTMRIWSKTYPLKKREAIPPLAFVGGHPRSGTTLLEQVLGAHPNVVAVDEPTTFSKVLAPEYNKSRGLSIQRLNILRRRYFQALQKEIGLPTEGKLILDKNPSPTAHLPIWLRVFPELRVLIALRDPRDVLISCYFQNIPLNLVNANFLSFERLATHYVDIMDVWLAVRQWEGFAWMETRYEDIVKDLRKEGGRVTEFLGLTWHERQAQFHDKNARGSVFSPSYHDVTKPVYQRSVERWRRYEKYLAPVLSRLEPYCRALGYS
jgi:tetratricopeptide (TPR) repeat protein